MKITIECSEIEFKAFLDTLRNSEQFAPEAKNSFVNEQDSPVKDIIHDPYKQFCTCQNCFLKRQAGPYEVCIDHGRTNKTRQISDCQLCKKVCIFRLAIFGTKN